MTFILLRVFSYNCISVITNQVCICESLSKCVSFLLYAYFFFFVIVLTRGGSRTAVTLTKRSILDFAAVLYPPLLTFLLKVVIENISLVIIESHRELWLFFQSIFGNLISNFGWLVRRELHSSGFHHFVLSNLTQSSIRYATQKTLMMSFLCFCC